MSFPKSTYTYGLPIQTFLYKPDASVVGGGCHTDVHLPPASVARPVAGFPVVIVVHGGGFITGCTGQLPASQVDYLLARGLAVVDIEYRLAPHAGIAEQNEDVLAAFAFVKDELNGLLAQHEGDVVVNGRSIGITGDSAGGYHSLMLGITAADAALKAVVPFYGLSDLTTLASGSKEDRYLGYNRDEIAFIERVFSDGALAACSPDWEEPGPRTEWRKSLFATDTFMSALVPENTPEARKTLSPIHLATAAYPPTFFAVPQFDSTVTPTQSWRFAEKLKALGVEVGTGRADGAGHCFDRRGGALNAAGGQWWDDVTRPALDFLVSHLVV